jgi:hypothetical protein
VTKAAVLKFKLQALGEVFNAIVGQGTWGALLKTFVPKAIITAPSHR